MMWTRLRYIEYPSSIRKNLIERDRENRNRKRGSGGDGGNKKKRRRWPVVLLVLLLVILTAAGTITGLYLRARGNIHPNGEPVIDTDTVGLDDDTAPVIRDAGKEIEYKGSTYVFNENIITVALLGIDKETLGLDYGKVGTGGQADTIALALYDTKSGKINVVVIPRDTMAEINIYDVGGQYIDIREQQICVAYAYGDGKKTSCENTIRSINRLLLGIPVDYYLAMDMDGIPALNDAIGGVTLNCLETIGRFTEGERITLTGEDADAYVRDRDMSKLDSDTARRERQKQYMQEYIDQAVPMIRSDFSVLRNLYDKAMKYVITDIPFGTVSYLASTAARNSVAVSDFITVPGTYEQGEVLAEYRTDKTAVFEMILSLYYIKQ